MPEMATSKYEIVLFYNPNSPSAEKTLGYVNGEALPPTVRTSMAKEFPGREITNDNNRLVQYTDSKKKERYRIGFKNCSDTKYVITNDNGMIVARPRIL